ncbi:TIGR02281 family clan AA aspartic protease [Sphingorhabdus arenilitoris]|uniref:TIGR02281 family clan AA aspartic protease n=1 Tax=Sphingorhabdus arenilitoris TaxID=1490041 RepID=A0ABV8RH93_9SPHN
MLMETGGQILYAIGALSLVVMALVSRRISMGETLRMALGWIAIFAVLFVLFSFRSEFKQIWNRVTSDLAGTANQSVTGSTVEITRGDDGHFSLVAEINGRSVPFLIDSGATITTLSSESAQAAGVEFDRSDYPVIVSTANGRAKSWRATVGNMKVETISLDNLNVHVSDNLGEVNLLGMNFLDQLGSWRVQGDKMILEP